MTAPLSVKRLVPEDAPSWAYWPMLESRVIQALPLLDPEAEPTAVLRHLRSLWATSPVMLGAWLAFRHGETTNGHGPMPEIVGHMLGWVDTHWGKPCLHIYQLQGEPGQGCLDLLPTMLMELDTWRQQVNRLYEVAGSPLRMSLVKFFTEQPEAYARWFRPFVETKPGGSIVTFSLSDVAMTTKEA